MHCSARLGSRNYSNCQIPHDGSNGGQHKELQPSCTPGRGAGHRAPGSCWPVSRLWPAARSMGIQGWQHDTDTSQPAGVVERLCGRQSRALQRSTCMRDVPDSQHAAGHLPRSCASGSTLDSIRLCAACQAPCHISVHCSHYPQDPSPLCSPWTACHRLLALQAHHLSPDYSRTGSTQPLITVISLQVADTAHRACDPSQQQLRRDLCLVASPSAPTQAALHAR